MKRTAILSSLFCLALAAPACVDHQAPSPSADESHLTSADAQFLELSFDGEALMPAGLDDTELHKYVQAQMFYLAGELDKTHRAHGRFGFVKLSNVERAAHDDGLELVTYSAALPVQWPVGSAPESYRVIVPRNVDKQALTDFNAKYHEQCGHNKYGKSNLWYDWRPVSTQCALGDDVVDVVADVFPSPDQPQGERYPEYSRFWEDDEFRVVLVHGTDGSSSVDNVDGLVRQYLNVKESLKIAHDDATLTTFEPDANSRIYEDWQLETTIPRMGGGHGKLTINALLTASLKVLNDDSAFDQRFDELTANADLVIYGGHSGLSKNIKALAGKGVVTEGQYQVFLLMGCSTFAYLDRSINDRRIEVNGADADPYGTRFLDVIVTGQPAYFHTLSPAITTVISALSGDEPRSYLDILYDLPASAVPVVAGELDNPTTVAF
jgi:hypothetical protein